MRSTPVVITGMGTINPLGLTVSDLWSGLKNSQCAIDQIKAFDARGFACQLAGEVPAYKIRDYIPKSARKSAKLMSRDIELAIIASMEAFKSAGITTRGIDPDNVTLDPTRTAVNLGAGLISCDLEELAPAVNASLVNNEFDLKEWGKHGIEHVTPLWLLKYLPNMLACHISIIHDIQGPSNTITCAETSALLSVIEAAKIIQRQAGDTALAGGAEAKVNPIVMARQCLIKRSTTANDKPDQACRPFDEQANGCVFGEAAGIVILEDRNRAIQRNAPVLAEIAGVGQSNCLNTDLKHLEPDGMGIQIAIEKALDDADIAPEDLDLIIPHGTAIASDDLAEATAIQTVLGEHINTVSVFPTKSMVSNSGAASGAIDLITAICAMQEGFIPGTRNCTKKAPGITLNINTEPVHKTIKYALCCSYSYGTQTAAVIIKNPGNNLSQEAK